MSFGPRNANAPLGSSCDDDPDPISWREWVLWLVVPAAIAAVPKVIEVVHDEIKHRRAPAPPKPEPPK